MLDYWAGMHYLALGALELILSGFTKVISEQMSTWYW